MNNKHDEMCPRRDGDFGVPCDCISDATIELVEHDDPNTIQRYVYERYWRDGSRYVRVHRSLTLGEVYAQFALRVVGDPHGGDLGLERRLYALDDGDVEWVSFAAKYSYEGGHEEAAALPFPQYGQEPGDLVQIACMSCSGGSEGDLMRVYLLTRPIDRQVPLEAWPFATVKTFCGPQHAAALAALATTWFEQ